MFACSRSSVELLLGLGAARAQPVEPAPGFASRFRLLAAARTQSFGERLDLARTRREPVRDGADRGAALLHGRAAGTRPGLLVRAHREPGLDLGQARVQHRPAFLDRRTP